MSKVINNAGNNDEGRKLEEALKEVARVKKSFQRKHLHNAGDGSRVIKVSDMDPEKIPDDKKHLPGDTLYCTKCKKYFYGRTIPEEVFDSYLWYLESTLEQVKCFAAAYLKEEDVPAINQSYDCIEYLRNVFEPYYIDMMNKIGNPEYDKKKKKRGGNGSSQRKGGYIGANPNSFRR